MGLTPLPLPQVMEQHPRPPLSKDSSNTDLIGFLTSFNICCKQTSSLQHTSPQFTGNLFGLVFLLRRSRRWHLSEMSNYGQILLVKWLNTCQSNSAFLVRSPRMNEHLSVLVGIPIRELGQSKRMYLFEDNIFQLKDSWLLTAWYPTLWLKDQWPVCCTLSILSFPWFAIPPLFFFCSERLIYKQMPLCSVFPGPLSVLMMDTVQIHHGAGILELAECFGDSFPFTYQK